MKNAGVFEDPFVKARAPFDVWLYFPLQLLTVLLGCLLLLLLVIVLFANAVLIRKFVFDKKRGGVKHGAELEPF